MTSCAPEAAPGGGPHGVKGPQHSQFEDAAGESDLKPAAVISVAGVDADGVNVTASGYVSQAGQGELKCSFTFTQGENEVVIGTTATPDHSGASCGAVEVPVAELQRGTWELVLSVQGAGLEITPDSMMVEVP